MGQLRSVLKNELARSVGPEKEGAAQFKQEQGGPGWGKQGKWSLVTEGISKSRVRLGQVAAQSF